MNQVVVWFNILAFTMMFAAFAFSLLSYVADRKAWLRSYLLYFASYAFWLLLATYHYFRITYIPGDHAALDLAVGWIRVGISLIIGYAAPLVVVQIKHGRASPRALLLLGIVPALVLAGMVVYTRAAVPLLATFLNIGFNGFQLAVAAWGIAVLKKPMPDPRAASLRAFFRLSIVLFALFIGYASLALAVRSAIVPAASTILAGVFGLAWSALVIVDQVKSTKGRVRDAQTLPPFFLAEYRITAREASIIGQISEGKTTREIGRSLFVSHRTVETHARNIYRKCGVSNKVELIRLIDSCRKKLMVPT